MRLLKEIRSAIGGYQVKSGVFHYYRNEFKPAVEFFRKALRDESASPADRRNARQYLTLSLVHGAARLEAEGDEAEAIRWLQNATETSPRYPDIHFRLGKLLERTGETEAAIRSYRSAVEHSEGFVEVRVALGLCLMRHGQRDEAARYLQEASELRMARIERPCRQALDCIAAGDDEGAEQLVHEAFHASPALCDLHLKKALAFLAAGEYERALTECDQALELNPKYPDLHNYRGVALSELERDDEAIVAFRRSVDLGPKQVVPRLNLAFSQVRAGMYKDAEAELSAILEDHPDEPAALVKLEEIRKASEPGRPARSAR